MAIHSSNFCENKNLKPVISTSSKGSNITECRLLTLNANNDIQMSISTNKHHKAKPNKSISPYLADDKVYLLSQLTEEKLYRKTHFVSSFPLAANIYKANSDEFKLKKKRGKNNKKSVLTLPNEPSVLPNSCTVSDMNDSEYFNRDNDKVKVEKPKKRLLARRKKPQKRNDHFEFYDRDAKYCSQVDIDLDCSSTDVIKNFKGDCKKSKLYDSKLKRDEDVEPHDVWAVLRNINTFQFHPSPPMSDDSVVLTPRKKRPVKKNKRKAARVIETCRTEQYAYLTINEVSNKSRTSRSPSSSTDRNTVIDKKEEFDEICGPKQNKGAENRMKIMPSNKKEKLTRNKHRRKKAFKDNFKAICSSAENSLKAPDTVYGDCKSSNGVGNKESLVSSNVTRTSGTSVDRDQKRDPSCNFTTEGKGVTGSGSNYSIRCRKGNEKRDNSPLRDNLSKMNGTAKISLSRGQELTLSRRMKSPTTKPRLVTRTPNSVPIPKLTQTDLRRRLANIKFPLVILGRDQLSAAFKVEPYDYPQFNGLDDHIWPFMLKWSNKRNNLLKQDHKDAKNLPKKRNNNLDRSPVNIKKATNCLVHNKQLFKDKKPVITNVNLPLSKKKESKQLVGNNEINVEVVKSRPMRQFRDKMLKLLYKNTSSLSTVDDNAQRLGKSDVREVTGPKQQKHKIAVKFDNNNTTTDIILKTVAGKQQQNAASQCLNVQVPAPPTWRVSMSSRNQWGKPKWASDFIENVIKKIKTGVYYNNDSQELHRTSRNAAKEVSVQTALPLNNKCTLERCEHLTPKITIQKRKDASTEFLPGFDCDIPQLEIKSLTRNQIAVKNCVTNVTLQFDITVPLESDLTAADSKRSTSCIPLSMTDSKTKLFKCKARIFNSMLPAEICSIIPRVIFKLANPETKRSLPLVQDNVSTLSTTSKLSIEAPSLNVLKLPLYPQIKMSSRLRNIVDGQFTRVYKSTSEKSANWVISIYNVDTSLLLELLPHPHVTPQYYFKTYPTSPLTWKPNKLVSDMITVSNVKSPLPETINLCTDLVPYSRETINTAPPQCLLSGLLRFMQKRMPILNLSPIRISSFEWGRLSSNLTVTFKVYSSQETSNTVSINVAHLKIDSLHNALTNLRPLECTNEYPGPSVKCIEYIKDVDNIKFKKIANETPLPSLIISNKHKKRKYVKLYKKCKSTSHISAEKSSTPLSKITNLEEFFQAMGTGKSLSSALDGYTGRKLLSNIIEMKSWITEISPRQALLVMLLTNKKDTRNLVRFRPVILQGIAVNRITRASELDMEIEVIERESFNKLPTSQGLPYLSDCARNDNNLLEELCWIAKTTASDYQKPFDESSEKLLKDLLEKRKKLNPSYLRVMARYVGLGLLKSPSKK